MKKIITLLLLVVTVVSTAQESTLLRLNYKTGEKFQIKMKMVQDMSAMGVFMKMNMEMESEVTDATNDVYTTKMSIKRIKMDAMQGGQEMTYDSNKKDEELDETGKMLQAQMKPMLAIYVTTTITNLGVVKEVIVEPSIPNEAQFKNQNGVEYPEKAVKVGSMWSEEKNNNGMKINSTYKVISISKNLVELSVAGKVTEMATGTLKGTITIDRESGMALKSVMNMDMTVQGNKMKTSVEMTTEKM